MPPSPPPLPAALPPLRRLPLPLCDPPYDDELPHPGRPPGWPLHAVPPLPAGPPQPTEPEAQGTLALAFLLPGGVEATPPLPPDLRLVPGRRAAIRPGGVGGPSEAGEEEDDEEFGPQPTGRARLPEPRRWAARFVQALVEALAGDRPVNQLVRWTSEDVYDELSARSRRAARSRAGAPAGQPRGVVRSVHVDEPSDGVAEVSALVRRGLRCTAVAVRLEGLDGRWQCTAVELG